MPYIGSAPTKVVSRQSATVYRYTATAGQTVFSGADLDNAVLACNPADMVVHMNGIRLESTDYTATSTSVTLVVAAAAGDEVTVTSFQTFEVADTYDKATADTRYVNASGDSVSGNLLVGKTSTGISAAGHSYRSDGTWEVRRDLGTANSSSVGYLSRGTTDGNILTFYKDTTSVGSIGAASGNTYIGSGDTGIGFSAADDTVYPITTATGGIRDAAIDLGGSTYRYKDLYLSGGVYLGGTGASNHLDDYEEGTWNVLYSGDSGSSILRTGNGKYIKIGRMVYISFYSYAGSNPTVPSGNCYVSLPFAADTSGHFSYMHIMMAYAGGLSFNTTNASSSRRWQINNSTQLTSYRGQWASSPSYYELSGAGCYIAAS